MPKKTISKQDIYGILDRCEQLLNTDIRILKEAHITKEMAQELHAKVKQLINDANDLGLVNKDALTKSGGWIGDDPVFVDSGQGTHCRKIRRTFVANNRSGNKGYLEHFNSVVSHIHNVATALENNEDVSSPSYTKKHAPGWKPAKLAA